MTATDAPQGTAAGNPAEAIGMFGKPEGSVLMLLRLGCRWFAMDVTVIEEVALKGQVTRVPMSPSHILGVTTLRGRLLTVIGLEHMIGGPGMFPPESSATLPRLVVVRDGAYEMAVVAEGIHGMIEHAPAAVPARSAGVPDFVHEEFDWQGHQVFLLDAHELLASAVRLAGSTSPLRDAAP